MYEMSRDERRAFLLEGTRTAKLATTRKDGRPHVAPVWFLLDGDDVVFTTAETSVKGHAIRRDPHVTLCVDDERPPFAYVVIEGTATVDPDLGRLREWAIRIGERYMGAERAEEYGARNAVPGELLVRVTPTKVLARARIAD
jgi:PPOX class probable F420-dependent enzyme